MKKIAIVVPKGAVTEAVADPRYLFNTANHFLKTAGKSSFFDVKMIGEYKEIPLQDGAFYAKVDHLIQERHIYDLVIIPAIFGDIEANLKSNAKIIPWILNQHANGAEIVSLCLGAFILAQTGLLDHKVCSTHWAYTDKLARMFPNVIIEKGEIISEDQGIYSSGGANSYWNLLLYLVEKYTTRELAILTSKYFAVDIGRESQTIFTIFNGQKDHGDELILQVQEYIEQNFKLKYTVQDLADQFYIGRRTLERRFHKSTGNTIFTYIQRVKVEAAKTHLEAGNKNISEIMYNVAYSDPKSFRDVFKKYVGLSPFAYKKKYELAS